MNFALHTVVQYYNIKIT